MTVREALANIEMGVGDGLYVFRCKECGETAGTSTTIKHTDKCVTKTTLESMGVEL